MKKMDVVEIYSRNNEIHFVLREHKNDKHLRNRTGFSYTEAKKVMKREAAKPLLLLRTEWLGPKNEIDGINCWCLMADKLSIRLGCAVVIIGFILIVVSVVEYLGGFLRIDFNLDLSTFIFGLC